MQAKKFFTAFLLMLSASTIIAESIVCIRNNAKLTVCDTVKCYRDVSFTIRPNSTLLVNGGTMEDADIKAQTGSNVKIQNNGRIIPCTNKNFSIPLGAKMNISSGRIK